MFKKLRRLIHFITRPRIEYRSLIEARIFSEALLHNLHFYQNKYPKLVVAPVLKSNAYGHGLTQVASILDNEHVPFFAVDSFFEALVLRQHMIKTKILVIGYSSFEQIVQKKLKNCSFSIIDLGSLEQLSKHLNQPRTIHLKIDTGMRRQGILVSQIDAAIQLIKSNPNILLEGIFSHLADADGNNIAFTNKQIDEWNWCVTKFRESFTDILYFHLAATHGVRFTGKIDANVCRLGIGLYGHSAVPEEADKLIASLELVSVVSSVRDVGAGDSIGYNATFTATRAMKVATIPLGYNEGIDRRLSNRGSVAVKGTTCPIVGRVSMNITSIDVTKVMGCKVQDEVVVIGRNPHMPNSIEKMAEMCNTIPYEIMVHIPSSIRRVIVS